MYQTTQMAVAALDLAHAARAIVKVGNYEVTPDSFSVEQNGYTAADTFTLELPFFIKDQSTDRPVTASTPNGASIIVATADLLPVKIYIGFPKDPNSFTESDLTLVMDGTMDTADWDFGTDNGEIVTLHGRNAVGKLIDTKISIKYQNMTSSAIATTFAQEHGLIPVVQGTSMLAGAYYNKRTAAIGADTSEWDMLLFLAKQETFVVRVREGKLFFGPEASIIPNLSPVLYTWGHDIERLHLERSPHAAKNIVVNVKGYDRNAKGKPFVVTADSTTQASGKIKGQLGARQKYAVDYKKPGWTRLQCSAFAKAKYAELSASQIIGTLFAGGKTGLAIDGKIKLQGVGKILETDYYLNRISHRFSVGEGYAVDLGFSTESSANLAAPGMDGSAVTGPVSLRGAQLASAAEANKGAKYFNNGCAYGVNDVLHKSGINLMSQLSGSPNVVTSYANVGQRINSVNQLQPGDLVTYNSGNHIGIYAGNGQAWSVTTSSRFHWEIGPVYGFTQGNRITK